MRWLCCVASLAGCVVEPPPDEPAATSHVSIRDWQIQLYRRDVDLVFVIDTTPGMLSYRDRIVEQMPGIANEMERDATLEDLHVAVITANPDDQGELVGGHFLHVTSLPTGGYRHNFTGSLEDRLAELVPTAFEAPANQPLAQVEHLLDDPAFRRPDAALMIVPITNRDDESYGNIENYIDRFAALGQDRVSLVPIYAPPAPRLEQFGRSVSSQLWTTAITSDDWARAAEWLFAYNKVADGGHCLDGKLVEPQQCVVTIQRDGRDQAPLPSCDADMANRPCYQLAPSLFECSGAPFIGYAEYWYEWPPPGTHVVYQCVVE